VGEDEVPALNSPSRASAPFLQDGNEAWARAQSLQGVSERTLTTPGLRAPAFYRAHAGGGEGWNCTRGVPAPAGSRGREGGRETRS
jgi:hypothetical protein